MGNIWVDLGAKTASVEVTITNAKTPELNHGNLGRASIADISLTGATITSDPATRTVSVQNASATLQAVTAETLNSVFIDTDRKGNGRTAGQVRRRRPARRLLLHGADAVALGDIRIRKRAAHGPPFPLRRPPSPSLSCSN